MILMLKLTEYVYDYASYDEVDQREDSDNGVAQSAAIVGGSREPSQSPPPPPPLQIAEPKVELRSFFPEDWLFSLEQLKETLAVFER